MRKLLTFIIIISFIVNIAEQGYALRPIAAALTKPHVTQDVTASLSYLARLIHRKLPKANIRIVSGARLLGEGLRKGQVNLAHAESVSNTVFLHPDFFDLTLEEQVVLLHRELICRIGKGIEEESAINRESEAFVISNISTLGRGIALQAGKIMLEIKGSGDLGTVVKADGTESTKADDKIQNLANRAFNLFLPGSGMMGEENFAIERMPTAEQAREAIKQILDRVKKKRFVWVVDPIDGTSAYDITTIDEPPKRPYIWVALRYESATHM
ncbi:MAG: hypothetical protein HQ572_01120, partial [Candidatus Omnitrophica bacterium]|nr:hypothetical protein [Candidatus Omnitrophota bacterium]